MVLSGHILDDGIGRLSSLGKNGNFVHQMASNYQKPIIEENGGNGWLRTLTFVPRENRIDVRTYSPWLDKWANDDQNRFELGYTMVSDDK